MVHGERTILEFVKFSGVSTLGTYEYVPILSSPDYETEFEKLSGVSQ